MTPITITPMKNMIMINLSMSKIKSIILVFFLMAEDLTIFNTTNETIIVNYITK